MDDLARLFPYTKALCTETTAECQPTPPTSTTPSQPSASHGFLQPVTPVASFMSGNLECGNAACRKALVPPLQGVPGPCMTAEQRRLVTTLNELVAAGDWWGVVELEREALALARELRGADPGLASNIHSVLGNGYFSTGDYGRAREMHEQHRAISEALGDRAGVASACGNLGNCYFSTGI